MFVRVNEYTQATKAIPETQRSVVIAWRDLLRKQPGFRGYLTVDRPDLQIPRRFQPATQFGRPQDTMNLRVHVACGIEEPPHAPWITRCEVPDSAMGLLDRDQPAGLHPISCSVRGASAERPRASQVPNDMPW